jgi:hypothetical protein
MIPPFHLPEFDDPNNIGKLQITKLQIIQWPQMHIKYLLSYEWTELLFWTLSSARSWGSEILLKESSGI